MKNFSSPKGEGFQPSPKGTLKKMPAVHFLELQTFKKDRSIIIIKQTEDNFQIREKGFQNGLFDVEAPKLKKMLKTLLKREFPRSNKVRLYSGSSWSSK